MYRTEYIYVTPPEQYVNVYDEPELDGSKNRDLLRLVVDQQEVIRLYRDDMTALQAWAEEVEAK